MCQGGKPDTGEVHSSYIGMNVCGSACENGCVVDGTCATRIRQRIEYYIYIYDTVLLSRSCTHYLTASSIRTTLVLLSHAYNAVYVCDKVIMYSIKRLEIIF